MVKQGPIPAFVHGLYEYVGGIALIALPLVLSYDHGAATAVSIILGVLVIFLAATTASTTSLINQLPLAAHIILDYVLVVILIASPFLFGFSGESTPTAVFIVAGLLHLLVSIGTRYRKEDHEPKRAIDRPAPNAVRDDEVPEFEPPPRQP